MNSARTHESCKTCIFWLQQEFEMSDYGWCRRFPPVTHIPEETLNHLYGDTWVQPVTSTIDFCGEYKPSNIRAKAQAPVLR